MQRMGGETHCIHAENAWEEKLIVFMQRMGGDRNENGRMENATLMAINFAKLVFFITTKNWW